MSGGLSLINILLLLGLLVFVIGLISLISQVFGAIGLPWQMQAMIIGLLLMLTASFVAKQNG